MKLTVKVLPDLTVVLLMPEGEETAPRTSGAGMVSVTEKPSHCESRDEHSTLKL